MSDSGHAGDAVAVLVCPGARRRLGRCDREALRAALIAAAALELPAVAISCGDAESSEAALTVALRAGCARAIRVEAPEVGGELALARQLAAVSRAVGPRFILCGDRAEGGWGVTGPALAEVLGWPHASGVVAVAAAAPGLRCRVHLAGESRWLEVAAPAIIAVRSAGAAAPHLGAGPRRPIESPAAEAPRGDRDAPGGEIVEPPASPAAIAESPAALVRHLRDDHLIES